VVVHTFSDLSIGSEYIIVMTNHDGTDSLGGLTGCTQVWRYYCYGQIYDHNCSAYVLLVKATATEITIRLTTFKSGAILIAV